MKFEFESDLHDIALCELFLRKSLLLTDITLKAAGGGSSSAHLTAIVLRKESLYSLGLLICCLTDLLLVGERNVA